MVRPVRAGGFAVRTSGLGALDTGMYTWQYYDVILLGVFVSMALGVVVGRFTAVPPSVSAAGFGLLAAAFIGHGLFVNGPVDDATDLTDEVDALN